MNDLGKSPEWLYVLLRDTIGHAETNQAKLGVSKADPDVQQRYEDRENFINGTTLGWAYARLRQNADELKEALKNDYGISVPSCADRLRADEAPKHPGS